MDTHDLIRIDGLAIANWGRPVFEDMHKGGLTAVNCTCSVWEGFRGTMANIARWKQWFAEHDDILTQIHSVADIHRAKAEGRVGVILGWQNTSGLEDDLLNVRLFRDLGVRIMQLTYNSQNLVGSGCYEGRDSGLSDFGREVIDAMNETGVLVDLSHVGPKTSKDAIRHSRVPVAYTHCCPMLKQHPRNKSDEQLRFIAEHGGFVGFASYTPFLPKGAESDLDDCVAAMDYVIDLIGEDALGIGTDWTQGHDLSFFEWLGHDKGRFRRLYPGHARAVPPVRGLESIARFDNFIPAMERAGWSETRIRKVLGENWLRFLGDVWDA